MDLSASNERLETENRKLKVAAIGMMAQLRELGHPADASELNISGLGLWTGGDDAGTEDKGGGKPTAQGWTQGGKTGERRRDGDGTTPQLVSQRAPRRLRVRR